MSARCRDSPLSCLSISAGCSRCFESNSWAAPMAITFLSAYSTIPLFTSSKSSRGEHLGTGGGHEGRKNNSCASATATPVPSKTTSDALPTAVPEPCPDTSPTAVLFAPAAFSCPPTLLLLDLERVPVCSCSIVPPPPPADRHTLVGRSVPH